MSNPNFMSDPPSSPTVRITAVVFDWRGTLVTELDSRGWVREALRKLDGRGKNARIEEVAIDDVLGKIHTPELLSRLQDPNGNTSKDRHHQTYFGVFRDAGLDDDLAKALWDVDSDPRFNTFAVDAAETIETLIDSGCQIGVLSNIHFDIKGFFSEHPFNKIDEQAFVLSYDVGIQKPDPAIFTKMLERLGTSAAETLMVGDRENRDGVARQVGMRALIVDPLTDAHNRQLDQVTAYVEANHRAFSDQDERCADSDYGAPAVPIFAETTA
ncbi:HAD family hydrolase [Nocardia sp. NPDC055321]